MDATRGSPTAISAMVGIGVREPHVREIQATRPALGWIEVHPENYMGGGPALERLLDLRRNYPLSLHGVGLSLGSADGIDAVHLGRLAALAARTEPMRVSEHLSWSVSEGAYLNDLLPLPYTEESLRIVAGNVTTVQETLQRSILVENPSRYLRFRHSPIPEPEFLAELARRTGCRLLCDVNNIFVSAVNFGDDPYAYLAALPPAAVGEIHVAGHARDESRGRTLLIDDHGSPVCDAVWALYRRTMELFGPVATLVEWDRNLPALPVLLAEAGRAEVEASDALRVHALAS